MKLNHPSSTNRTASLISTLFAITRLLSLCVITSLAVNAQSASSSSLTLADIVTEDKGEYYVDHKGNTKHFFRKKNVYVDLSTRSHKSAKQKSALRNAANTNDKEINSHRFGNMRIFQKGAGQKGARAAYNSDLAPIYTDANGTSERLLLPEIIGQFNTTENLQSKLDFIQSSIGLYSNKASASQQQQRFTFKHTQPINDYSALFTSIRALSALPYIDWAEPNEIVRPIQSASASHPNDTLYRNQWSLNNWGKDSGQLCNDTSHIAADIDANDAWDLMATLSLQPTPVIAVIDDGVNISHPDLNIWVNPNPNAGTNPANLIAGTTNYCVLDTQGCDFGNYCEYLNGTGRYYGQKPGASNSVGDLSCDVFPSASDYTKPTPQTANDDHGTMVAGIASAKRNNTVGIAGVAYNSSILPIRLDFSNAFMLDCTAISDALTYAAMHADIINNSWSLTSDSFDPYCNGSIDTTLDTITSGSSTLSGSFKRNTDGTPVVFSAGNSGAGWRNLTVTGLNPGINIIRLAYHRDTALEDPTLTLENKVWIDNVLISGHPLQNFDSGFPTAGTLFNGGIHKLKEAPNETISSAGSVIDYKPCGQTFSTSIGNAVASGAGEHVFAGTGNSIALSPDKGECQFLEIEFFISTAGTMNFRLWVSTEPWEIINGPNGDQFIGDPFRVYVNGNKTNIDLINKVAEGLPFSSIEHNVLSYPASHPNVIAVGASDAGDLLGIEERYYKSQYSDIPDLLDVVAPGRNIQTTRGSSYGILSGTSASAAMVSGVIANMLAVNANLPFRGANSITEHIQNGADQIGPERDNPPSTNDFSYDTNGFNQYYGHGRLNSYKSVHLANSSSGSEPEELCEDPNPDADPSKDDFLGLVMPAILAGACKQRESTSNPCN